MEEGATWGVGLVRRLRSPAEGVTSVGIEYLSRGVVKVDLTGTSAGPSGTAINALMLLSSNEGSAHKGEVSMMLPPGTFAMDRNFTMRALERTYSLLPRKLLESGAGYELTRFLVRLPES
jgi:hypothetical protein